MDYFCKRCTRLRNFFKFFFTSIYLLILSLDAAHAFHPPVGLRPTIYEPAYKSNYHPNRQHFNTPILSLCNKNDLISRIIRSSNNPCNRRNEDYYLFTKTKKTRDRSSAGFDDSFAIFNNNERRISKRSAGQADDVKVKTLDDLFKNFNPLTPAPINRRALPRKKSRKRKRGGRKKHHKSNTQQNKEEAPFFTSKEGDTLTIAGLNSPAIKETAKYSLLVHDLTGKYLEITKQHSIQLTRKLNENCYLVVKTDDFGTVRLQGDSTEDFLAMHSNGSLYATVFFQYDQYISKNYGVYLFMNKSGKPPKRPVKKSRKGTFFMELKRNEIELGRENHNSVSTTNHIQDNEEAFFPTTARMTSLAPKRGRKGRKNNKRRRKMLRKRRRGRKNRIRNNKKKSKSGSRSTRNANSLLGFDIQKTDTIKHATLKRNENQEEIIFNKSNTAEVLTSDSSTHARDDT